MASDLDVNPSQEEGFHLAALFADPSSVQSTPYPSPPSSPAGAVVRCAGCGWAVADKRVYPQCPQKHVYCKDCVPTAETACVFCQHYGPKQPHPPSPPSARQLHLQAVYDSRCDRQVLPEPLKRIEVDEKDFVHKIINYNYTVQIDGGEEVYCYEIDIQRAYRKPCWSKWQATVTLLSSKHDVLNRYDEKARSLTELFWLLNRRFRSTHYCRSCRGIYTGKPGCMRCAARDVLQPGQVCGIHGEKTGLIYDLPCGHVFCKPCLIHKEQQSARWPIMCPHPGCDVTILVCEGWAQCKGSCWCGPSHM